MNEDDKVEHPGAMLRRSIRGFGLTSAEFAQHIGISKTFLGCMLSGHRRITPMIAIWLEQATAISAQFWVSSQAVFDLQETRTQLPYRRIEQLKKTDKKATTGATKGRCICGHWSFDHLNYPDGPCTYRWCTCPQFDKLEKLISSLSPSSTILHDK